MANEHLSLSLPQDFPECWTDEARMNVLFAPFRSRNVNPQDWDSKLTFWKNLILQCCVHSQVYTFKAEDLQKVLTVNGRYPKCLNIVIDEMYKSGDIKPVEEFLEKPAQSWGRWASDIFIKKPIIWSYSKIKNSLVTPVGDHTFVYISAVQKEAENLVAKLPEEFRNNVLNLQMLLDAMKIDATKADSIKLLLHYLVCSGKADVRELESEAAKKVPLHNLLIKFGDIKTVKGISDLDVSLHILEQNEKILTKNLEKLENEASVILADAKLHLVKGHRQMAKNCLRKKHEVESRIAKRVNALQNIQVLLLKTRDADADAQVLDSYKLALSTLRSTFKETGLSEDAVADTMSELGEVLDMHADIQTSLSQSFSENDAELEEELAELIAGGNKPTPPKPPSPTKPTEEDDSDDLEKRLQNLRMPAVPSTSPVIKSKVSL